MNDTEIGEIIICDEAIEGEGFSRYYQESFSMSEIVKKEGVKGMDPAYIEFQHRS